MTIAARVKAMKVGGPVLTLDTPGERAKALAIAKSLREAGAIDFKITTTPNKHGGFTASAHPE